MIELAIIEVVGIGPKIKAKAAQDEGLYEDIINTDDLGFGKIAALNEPLESAAEFQLFA